MTKGHVIKKRVFASIAGIISAAYLLAHTPGVVAAETVLAPLKITEIYPNAYNSAHPGGPETGYEFVEIANLSATPIDLSGYGLRSKGKTKKIDLTGTLQPYEYRAVPSTSSFALVNTGETIQLVKIGPPLEVIEEVTYGNTPTKDFSWSYFVEGWELLLPTPGLPNAREAEPDQEPEPELEPEEAPPCFIEISEVSAQVNHGGKEYIEFVNFAETSAQLQNCSVQINTKADKTLPELSLEPQQRYVWELSSGTIANDGGIITLTHSDGAKRVYQYQATNTGQVINYEPSKVTGTVSDIPTPGEPNQSNPETAVGGMGRGAATALADCGPGKYRNPETNRCRNIETASTAALAPCAADQERNPATNRCRKIAVATATLKPCAADQFRNPETNRCKKIVDAEGALKPCAVGQERNPETNRCRKIATSVSGTPLEAAGQPAAIKSFKYKTPMIGLLSTILLGYGAYEYRTDIRNYLQRFRDKRLRGRPPG